jgi:hypothetical protein
MITKLETGIPQISEAGAPTGKSSNTLLYVVLGLGLLYLGYKFVYLPAKQKKENESAQ